MLSFIPDTLTSLFCKLFITPTRSPDLLFCGFVLWGYLKVQVYSYRHTSLQTLKETIIQAVAKITPEITRTSRKGPVNVTKKRRPLVDVMFKPK